MKRRLTAAAAGILAASMMFGTTAFAQGAQSPTTKTTTVASTGTSSETKTTGTVTTPAYYIPRGADYLTVAGTRVEGDYSGVLDNTMLSTSTLAQPSAAVTKALDAYIAATEDASKTVFGTYKVQMYKSGKAVWDGFGTFQYIVCVGNKYEGKTFTVYAYHKDGTVTKMLLTVTKGKLVIPMTEMATLKVLY